MEFNEPRVRVQNAKIARCVRAVAAEESPEEVINNNNKRNVVWCVEGVTTASLHSQVVTDWD